MMFIEGGAFLMAPDGHYREEGSMHRVSVDGFHIDEPPVTNAEFSEFIAAVGYRSHAEFSPDPKDYPGTVPDMLHAGSLAFHQPKGPVGLEGRTQRAGCAARLYRQ